MARKYEKVRELLPVVQRLQAEGKTRKEIARELGLQNERTVKDCYLPDKREVIDLFLIVCSARR